MGYKTQDSKRQLRVFLCHASADKPKVRELYRYLRRRGIRPWFDEIDLVGGQDWQVEIPKALATSDAIIICLTKNSVDKEGYIQKEIKFALDKALEMPEGRIFLIPVRFEECEVPFSLSRYQWVDLFDEAGYIRMMRALKFRASQLERTIVELPQKDIEEEKIVLEEAAREKEERETADKATREKLEWEAAEKATREQAERETAERDAREKAEREATEKAMREKVRSDAAEKTRRERAARKSAQMVALKEAFFRSFNSFKLVTPKAKSLLRIGSILGIIFVLFWVGSWAMPNFSSFFPTAQASATLRSISTVTLSPMPPTRTLEPVATPTVTQTSGSTALPTEITDAKGVQMVLVPAGEFTKGSDNDFEQPVAQAYLDAFYMDKYEVTNAHYKSCVDAGVCDPPKDTSSYTHANYYDNSEFDNYPVIWVDWFQARDYCEWRGAQLPTDSQWEKAARGADGRTYPWGEGIDCNKANYSASCRGDTTEVGSFESGKSPYGVYDLAGNVWEWVADWSAEPILRMVRDGSWESKDVTSTYREGAAPSYSDHGGGFRCSRSP